MTAAQDQAQRARDVRRMTRTVTDARATNGGRRRSRRHEPVHHSSVDIDDPKANVRGQLGETLEEAIDCMWALVVAVSRYREQTKAAKEAEVRITAEELLLFQKIATPIDNTALDYWEGSIDLARTQFAALTGVSVHVVDNMKAKMKALGVFDVTRRTIATGLEKMFGVPQRIQISDRTHFTPERLIPALRRLFDAEYAKRRAHRKLREAVAASQGRPVQHRPLRPRERPKRRVPALLNPAGWARALAAAGAAATRDRDDFAAREARDLAYATELAARIARESGT